MFANYSIGLRVTSLLAVVAIFFGLLTSTTNALTVDQEMIQEQKLIVMSELVDTLEEDVKLLQMLFIQRLEERVDRLQALVRAQA